MALSETSNLQSNKFPRHHSQFSPELADDRCYDPGPATVAGSRTPDQADAAGARREPATPFPQSWYRPRFIVLPTGRLVMAWGIWDCQKNPLGSIPTCLFRMTDFVSCHRNLGKAYKAARRLNEKHERKAVA